MTTENRGNTETVLHHWRTTVLNGFLIIAVIISVPALAAIVAYAISKPAMWPTAIAFSIAETVLIAMAVFRRLSIWLRVGGLFLARWICRSRAQPGDHGSGRRQFALFYAHAHRILGESMFAENLSIALYDENTGLASCTYQVDEREDAFPTQPLEDLRSMSGYILRTGSAIRHGAGYLDDIEKLTVAIDLGTCMGYHGGKCCHSTYRTCSVYRPSGAMR